MTIPAKAPERLPRSTLAIQVFVYVLLAFLTLKFLGPLIVSAGGPFFGVLAGTLALSLIANVLTLRFFTTFRLADLGLYLNRMSMENIAIGILGGIGTASLVLAPPLLFGRAHIAATPTDQPDFSVMVFVILSLALAAMGEELMMRGYAFQILLSHVGIWATIIPVGLVFAWLHTGNPNASWLGIANTAGFGIVFGYAFVRSRDLWLPAGLHFGWNVTLPLFGVNVSGIRMKITGHAMVWSAGNIWSGGDYGPEASVLTSVALFLLAFFICKAPIRRQPSPLSDPPAEPKEEVCAP